MPSEGNLVDLEKKAVKLIDRGQGPSATDRRLTGIPKRLLPGHPYSGGFGALPLPERTYPGAVGKLGGVVCACNGDPGEGSTTVGGSNGLRLTQNPPCVQPLMHLTSRPEVPTVVWGNDPAAGRQAGGHGAGVPAPCRGHRRNPAGNGRVVLERAPLGKPTSAGGGHKRETGS